ncbi:MAG: rhodanese-like domain-containing protein [Acidobacteriota bacterium]|nr:rhodanese-like domain-containing protein [Blastocatellia bacterium]MDW8411976.1 rhodanese-like domain-containing protein [Acidobacteriota bacterium]
MGAESRSQDAEVLNITPVELKRRLELDEKGLFLLDVREPFEYEICRIEGSTLMPMSELWGRIELLDPSKEIVVICHAGVRSAIVASWLRCRGFTKVLNLKGGIDEWAATVDPAMPRY